ncbi:class I adenylate-forming enzyme family protein [Nocardioides insulae]|uniref:class I adenylate-forming enzyme family protein n=1 Tax=Nocardioides insulae TaxID=394734 RepID=UPI0003F541BC|nr:class I adenylate-forming enzyme family protein [Nocardioides insulae]
MADSPMLQRTDVIDFLTAPGQEFEMVEQEVRGVPLQVYSGGLQTLRELALATGAFGDLVATVYDEERVTYTELSRQINGLARCLHDEYGLRRGDRVAVAMRNYPEWAPAVLACQALGVVTVPLNAWWSAAELRYAIEDSGARLLIADAERIALVAPYAGELAADGDKLPMIEVRGGDPAPGVRSWSDVMGSLDPQASAPEVEVHPDDDATILYTSGTTGKPKGAVGTHRNHATTLRTTQLGAVVGKVIEAGGPPPPPAPDAPQPGLLNTFPIFHIAGLSGMLFATGSGAKLVTQYRWNAAEACALVAREQLGAVAGVPTVVRELVEVAATHPEDLATLGGLSAGGAPVPPDLIGRIGSQFERTVAPTNGYGLTETTSAVVANTGTDYLERPDSVGRLLPGSQVRVVDPATGEDAAPGQTGELWFRGPTIVRGYWNNPSASEAAFGGGWFRTGDIGRVDGEWVYVLDRLKDMVLRGGENIYCAEVEAALFEHPAIQDATLVGVPHPTLGEEAIAVILPRPGQAPTEAEIQAHVGERLAAFKVPARVLVWGEPLPRTVTGKVLKRDLRTVVAERVSAER